MIPGEPMIDRLPLPARLRYAAADLLGYRYAHASGSVRFPRPFGPFGADHPLVDPGVRLIDCSSMTTYLVMRAFPWVLWTAQDYGDLQVFADRIMEDPRRPFAPIEAVEHRGVGSRVRDPEALPVGAICLVQVWRSLPPDVPRGHALIAEVVHAGIRLWHSTDKHSGIGPCTELSTWHALRKQAPAGMMVAALGPG